jgi:hypothetical protein
MFIFFFSFLHLESVLLFSFLIPFVSFFARNEPPVVPNEKPKKRQRKDLLKAPNDSDDGRISNKPAKLGKSTVEKLAPPP